MKKPYYLTTAIEYVNGIPHVGHAYEKIGADIIARAMRLRGYDVVFQMGTDEHSTSVARKAAEQGMEPVAFTDMMVEKFVDAWQAVNLSYDVFIRTTEERHVKTVQDVLQRIHDNGDIFTGTYNGYYCPSCDRFYTEKDLIAKDDGRYCEIHDIPCEWIEEENYFFRLSKYQQPLLDHIKAHPEFILPEKRRNEIVNVLKDGLDDVSISRSGVTWGVPLPWDENAVCYVWFDALINYVSAVGYSDDPARYEKYWPAQLQVIGKDITRFHCIYWPAMLMAAGLPLPTTVFGHGFVNFGGEKFSKTKGNVIAPRDVTDKYGADALRYYMAREIQWGSDGDFTWERFYELYNSDLANNLGNMVNRSLTMAKRFSDDEVVVPDDPAAGAGDAFDTALKDEYLAAIDEHRLQRICRALIGMVDGVNLYIDRSQPWVLAKDESKKAELQRVLYNLAEAVRWVAILAYPVIPEGAAKIWEQLNMPGEITEQNIEDLEWGGFPSGITVKKAKPIYPRIEPEEQ